MRITSGLTWCLVVVCVTALPSAIAMKAAENAPAKPGQKAESNSKEQPMLTDMLVYFAVDSKRERVGVIRPDGTGESFPTFALPEQSGLRMGQVSPDGRYAELMNLSAKKYWRYDFIAKTATEAKQRQGEALPGGTRFLYPDNSNNVLTLSTADADGGNRIVIYSGPGYAYGFSLSPDGCKYAYHITGVPDRPGYEIYVIDIESKKSLLIAGDYKYLHFGPAWSPDGQWLLYQRCAHQQDPGHDRSDLCLSRADGSEHRMLTTGQSHWFAAAIGTPERHYSGSNRPAWSPDGQRIACTLLLPDSQTAWPWQANRPDTDHFNRDYHPEIARGGTQVCLIDATTGQITPITHDSPPTWNFRPAWSPDGSQLAFMRADVGKPPELWVMNVDGSEKRLLTRGLNGTGADFVRWIRLAVPSL